MSPGKETTAMLKNGLMHHVKGAKEELAARKAEKAREKAAKEAKKGK